MPSSTIAVLTVQNPSLVIFSNVNVNTFACESRYLSNDLHERDSRILHDLLNISDLKAVAFSIADNQEHNEIYKLKLKCRDFCEKNNIKNVFLMSDLFDITAALLTANLEIKYGDIVSIIIAKENKKVLVYTVIQDVADCRILSKQHFTPSFVPNIKEEALDKNKPNKIIITYQCPLGASSYWKLTKPTFDSVKEPLDEVPGTSVIEKNINECMPQSWVFTILTLINERFHKFSIRPTTFETVAIMEASKASKDHIFLDSLILVSLYKSLPLTRICCPRPNEDFVICHYQHFQLKCLETINTSVFKNHKVSVTLKIDSNSFYQIKIEPIGNKIIDAFMIFHDKTFTLKVPNHSTQNFDNIPFCLAMVNGSILVGNETKNLELEQRPYLIEDLLKIISIPPDNLKPDPSWNFKITSDEKNPILLEFDTFKGKRKATPIHLLMMIIKWSVKQIENLTGVKHTYWTFYGNFNDYSKFNIMSACNTLEIDANFETTKQS